MQVGGTLRGTRAISLLVFLVPLIGYAYSSPLQYLPNIPGYVPVYIRYGDEPLEEINADLAEAFGETSNSVKSLQKIDHTFAHESDSFKDEDLNEFLEESDKKHPYPLHVREAESRSFATANDESGNPNKPKLLTIYELHDDNESRPRRRYRGRTRMKSLKPPAFKVSPLSDEEKEELEKLAIEVEKEETRPNEFYIPNPKYSDLLSDKTNNPHRADNFVAPIKVQDPLNESLTDLGIITVEDTDLPKPSDNHDNAVSEIDKKEPPIKEQRPATVLSNVDKVSPIDLPDESDINEDITSKAEKEKLFIKEADLPKLPQVTELSKSLDDHNIAASRVGKKEPPIKEQRPATILSNVDKVSPIDLPDESEINENKTKDPIESTDEIATSL
ncbi:uncharacterized protein LOC105250586 [Camponotus floridanus]|uniref:uncharacterized protein LOC105250586 n=1 Tax=Camponotus floridanus TaxID=104421 RepID=UPI000DC68454|nr:uncharacterized protein LOC105250586 [Camponotus floridanus]